MTQKFHFITPERIMEILVAEIAEERGKTEHYKQIEAPLLAKERHHKAEALDQLRDLIKLDERMQSEAYIDDFETFQKERVTP